MNEPIALPFSSVEAALIGIVLGAIIGSFLATIALRWPQQRSVSSGRSACDGCGRTLTPRDLIPLISWAIARGRCRSCGTPIAMEHPVIEAGCALIGGLALWWSPTLGGAALALLGWQLLLLGWLDARYFWLPRVLSYTLIATGLIAGGQAMAALGLEVSLLARCVGAVIGFVALWLVAVIYRLWRKREGLGGGDPPMLAGIAAWTGPIGLPAVMLAASIIGLLMAIIIRLRHRTDGAAPIAIVKLPFGTLMALGTPIALVLMASRLLA